MAICMHMHSRLTKSSRPTIQVVIRKVRVLEPSIRVHVDLKAVIFSFLCLSTLVFGACGSDNDAPTNPIPPDETDVESSLKGLWALSVTHPNWNGTGSLYIDSDGTCSSVVSLQHEDSPVDCAFVFSVEEDGDVVSEDGLEWDGVAYFSNEDDARFCGEFDVNSQGVPLGTGGGPVIRGHTYLFSWEATRE